MSLQNDNDYHINYSSDENSESENTNVESNSERRNEPTRKKMRIWKSRKFRKDWLEEDRFKGWLREKNSKISCEACGVTLHITGGIIDLKRHMGTTKHKSKMCAKQTTMSMTGFINDQHQKQLFNNKLKAAEIKISLFFAEHNIAIKLIDDMVPLIKDIAVDTEVIKKIELGRTKCTNIINNILCCQETEDLCRDLRNNYFSILVDESTDIGADKFLCVLVKYMKYGSTVVHTRLLKLLKVDAKSGTAENLYKQFKQLFEEMQVPLKNIIGMASDGASVMIGEKNSFHTRLEQDTQTLILLRCICHSAAIIANKACLELPRTPEDLIRAVSTYTGVSAKRSAELQEFQEHFGSKKLKILRLSSTRWLALYEAIERFTSQWDILKHFFIAAASEDRLKQSEFILQSFTDDVKCYFLFLKYVLNYFNQFNAMFQSADILIGDLAKESRRLYKKIAQNFLKVCDFDINIFNPHNLLPLKDVYLGTECESLLQTINNENCENNIRKNCLRFYQTALTETKKRLPLNNDFFDNLNFISIPEALSTKRNITSLKPVIEKFSPILGENSINVHSIEEEWRDLPIHFDEDEKEKLKTMSITEFWTHLETMKNFNNSFLFKNVCFLAKVVIILPHSNADSERIFSIVTDVKTKKRNCMGENLLNSICVLRSSLADQNLKSVQYNVTPSHLKKMKSETLFPRK